MDLEDAWTLTIGLPVRMLDGRYGRLVKTDMQTETFHVEVFWKDTSLGVRELPFAAIDRLRPGCDALIENVH